MSTVNQSRATGKAMLATGLAVLAVDAVLFFSLAEPFPIWVILIAIGATFTSVGAGMLMQDS